MTIIITGVAGFIGGHCAARFMRDGHRVVGVDNLSRPGSAANRAWLQEQGGPLFTFYQVDVRYFPDLSAIFRSHSQATSVIHEAAQVAVTTSVSNPRADFEVNALGTFNVLEAARQLTPSALVVFASTNKVYGALSDAAVVESDNRYAYKPPRTGIDENRRLDFHSPYGCSKGCADQYVRDYSRIYGIPTVVFRQSCIYGTRQFGVEDQGWVSWFAIAALLGLPLTVYGDGKQVRDLLWIDDLVDVYELAVSRPAAVAGKIYNIGGGPQNTLSVLELLNELRRQFPGLAPTFSGWRPGDQKIYVSGISRAASELGWSPSTSPATGLRRLLDWATACRPLIERVLAAKEQSGGIPVSLCL